MLSLGIDTAGQEISLAGLTDRNCTQIVGIPHSEALIRFVDALVEGDAKALSAARDTLVDEMGPEAFVDAAGVTSNFQRMVRIADSTGIPLELLDEDGGDPYGVLEMSKQLNEQLGINDFVSAANTIK
jgi:hypothetical protein